MVSFAQRFGFSKKGGGENSIRQEVILESMAEAQESLAERISQHNSSYDNIETLRTPDSKASPIYQATAAIENEIDSHRLERLFTAIEKLRSPEEIKELSEYYENLLEGWSKQSALLRNKKHLKEYLSITAALAMLQKVTQHPNITSGAKLSNILQNSLQPQLKSIEKHASDMLVQNQKLHAQRQQITKQLSTLEQSMRLSVEAGRKSIQQNVTQLQESVKNIQQLQKRITDSAVLNSKNISETLQKVQQQQERVAATKQTNPALQPANNIIQQTQKIAQQAKLIQQTQQAVTNIKQTVILHSEKALQTTISHITKTSQANQQLNNKEKAHTHTANCGHTHDHKHTDAAKKHDHHKEHNHEKKGHIHTANCGHTHDHKPADATKKHDHQHKKHNHGHGHDGPCNSACGHGAKASELHQAKQHLRA